MVRSLGTVNVIALEYQMRLYLEDCKSMNTGVQLLLTQLNYKRYWNKSGVYNFLLWYIV